MPDTKNSSPDLESRYAQLMSIELEYLKGGTLSTNSIHYLIQQSAWALRLSEAGEALNQSSSRYIEELEREVERLNTIINEKGLND